MDVGLLTVGGGVGGGGSCLLASTASPLAPLRHRGSFFHEELGNTACLTGGEGDVCVLFLVSIKKQNKNIPPSNPAYHAFSDKSDSFDFCEIGGGLGGRPEQPTVYKNVCSLMVALPTLPSV